MTDSGEGILLSTAPMERKVVQDISVHEKDIQKTTHETFDPVTGNLTSRDIQEHIRKNISVAEKYMKNFRQP